MARNITYREAINEALAQEMERDDSVIVMGEDNAGGAGSPGEDDAWGGVLGVTKGLYHKFPGRVLDTPISESAFIGAAIGAQIGSVATKYVKGYGIRVFFGIAVIGCGISILFKIVAAAFSNLRAVLDGAASVLILGLVSALSLFILLKFIGGVREERAALKAAKKAMAAHG